MKPSKELTLLIAKEANSYMINGSAKWYNPYR